MSEGIYIHLPSCNVPLPDFDPEGKFIDKDSLASGTDPNDDNVSISLSVNSAQDDIELGHGGMELSVPPSRQADVMSVSSGMSGHVAETMSPSASGMNLSDSNIEADGEDNEAIYEDISEICDNLNIEAKQVSDKEANKKSTSILKFLKNRKSKAKKGKEKPHVSEPEVDVDLEFHEEDEDIVVGGGGGGREANVIPAPQHPAPLPPQIIPTDSHSSDESYDKMGPGNSAYLSDNYEDFEASEASAAPVIKPPPVPNSAGVKNKSKRPALKDPIPSPNPGVSLSKDDNTTLAAQIAEKKSKLKDNMMRSATLPRKLTTKLKAALKNPELPEVHKKLPEVVPSTAMSAEADMREQVSFLRNEVESLKSHLSQLSSTVEMLVSQSMQNPSEVGFPGGSDQQGETTREENLKALHAMSLEQV